MLMLDLYSVSPNVDLGDILRIEQVLATTGLCRTMLYQLIREGTFPRQVALGARGVGWRKDEVIEWKRNLPVKHGKGHEIGGPARKTPDLIPGILATPPASVSRLSRRNAANPAPTAEQAAVDGAPKAPLLQNHLADTRGATLVVVKAKLLSTAAQQIEQAELLRAENGRLRELLVELVLRNDKLLSDVRNISMRS
jgi:prophage regulatory protein